MIVGCATSTERQNEALIFNADAMEFLNKKTVGQR